MAHSLYVLPDSRVAAFCRESCSYCEPAQTYVDRDGCTKNTTIYHNCMLPIDRPHPTVMQKPGFWCDREFRTIREASVTEVLTWQTFPIDYCVSRDRKHKFVGIGNAIPPTLAELICLAASARNPFAAQE